MSGLKGMKWCFRNYNHRPFYERSIESKLKESSIGSKLKESGKRKSANEGLALEILLNAFGNEESMNQACDLIKELGLVEYYH